VTTELKAGDKVTLVKGGGTPHGPLLAQVYPKSKVLELLRQGRSISLTYAEAAELARALEALIAPEGVKV
jgi:hypothetical protein